MDFIERLAEHLNKKELPQKLKIGYLDINKSFVIYPMPGSKITQEYIDGETDQQINCEIAMKSKNQKELHDTLWKVQTELEKMKELESKDDTFSFNSIEVTNKPYINQLDEQGWLIFILDIQAELTIKS